MKKLWFISLLAFCLACDEDYTVDPTLLPPATTTGAKTMGCLVDGWVYSSKRFGDTSVDVYQVERGDSVVISAYVGDYGILKLSILNPEEKKTLPYVDAFLDEQKLEDGEVNITRMSGGVLSGTFEGGSVTRGRFDVKYEKPE